MNLPCLGIDIAKLKFNVCLLQLNGKLKHKVFSNTLIGFAELHDWFAKQSVLQVHACLEAKALYFPAITALRCSPFFQQWAEGLRARREE